MARNRYLVTYDIADDDRRNKVFRALRDHGEHLRLSVFQYDLDARELVALRSALHERIHHSEDQVLLIDLGPCDGAAERRVVSMGRPYLPGAQVRII